MMFIQRLQRLLIPEFPGNGVVMGLILLSVSPIRAAEAQRTFDSPKDAVMAFVEAVKANDRPALLTIFGPEAEDLFYSGDEVADRRRYEEIKKRLAEATSVTTGTANKAIVKIGAVNWPFPIPLVQTEGKWRFDTAAGAQEILHRRIGENEIKTLRAQRGYVEAQREYASKDRTGEGIIQYAQKFWSADSRKDGLYWPETEGGEESPLGPLVAEAAAEGYTKGAAESTPKPYNGYKFRILKAQGSHAPGGAYSYVINGHMVAGFGLVAWPAEYGDSGVMTFIVNQNGKVYEKDLGAETEKTASAMKVYDPGDGWQVARD